MEKEPNSPPPKNYHK